MPHHVYIKCDIYLNIANHASFDCATMAGIEAIFILLGESDLTQHQDPISWSKLHNITIASINCILGLTINTCHHLLRTTWGPHR